MAAKFIGAGLATIALATGAPGAIGIFAMLIGGTARNLYLRKDYFNTAIMTFALFYPFTLTLYSHRPLFSYTPSYWLV